MEHGVLPYQGSSNPTFQKEEELSPVKKQIFIYMEGNKKMINLHEQKFPDLNAFQVNTSARLKNVEAQIGHLVQAFKENSLGPLLVTLFQIPMNALILL